jgi:hypothetical protein
MNCPYTKIQNPYFKNQYKKIPLWKKGLKVITIPFLYLFTTIIFSFTFIIRYIFKSIHFLHSLFTDIPIPIDKHNNWCYRRGKRISKIQLFEETITKHKKAFQDRLENGPNIQL